jgi:hypothetical protein
MYFHLLYTLLIQPSGIEFTINSFIVWWFLFLLVSSENVEPIHFLQVTDFFPNFLLPTLKITCSQEPLVEWTTCVCNETQTLREINKCTLYEV